MKSPWRLIWQPKNWLLGLFFIILRLITLLPYFFQIRLGKLFGRIIFYVDAKGRRIAQINLNLCFPELSVKQRQRLLKKNYAGVGMGVVEGALAWFGSNRQMPALTLHGLENWQALHQKNQPILLISAHFNSLEIVGRLLADTIPIEVVYRPQKLALVDAFVKFYRQKTYQTIIPRDNLRKLIDQLKKKSTVWYTPDIDAGSNNSVFVPFFSIPAATISASSRLAKITQASCMTIFFYRKEDLSGYEAWISPPLEDFPSGDDKADTARLNGLIEAAIRYAPDQYLWQYKRFKTRPQGQDSVYDT